MSHGKRPTECVKCKPYFSFVIQAEARQIAVREGVKSAQAFVDEKLEPFHTEHEIGLRPVIDWEN